MKTMFSYYLKCRKSTKSKNRKIVETKTRRVMLLSKCSMCNSEKLKFLKEQGVKGWLSSLGKKATLSQILLLGPLLF